MRKLVFDTHEEISEYMVSTAQDGKCVEAIVYYEDAIDIMKDLAQFEDVIFECFDIAPYDYEFYDKEYYVYLAEDMTLSIMPASSDGKYLKSIADIHLVYSDASSSILKYLEDGEKIEFDIYICDEEEDFNEIMDNIFDGAKITKDKNGNITGIEINNKDLKFYFNKFFTDLT